MTLNLSRCLRLHRIRRADAKALVDGERRWTYAELDADVDRRARALLDLGAARGEIVATLARNHAEHVIELFAISRIGAIALPINWRLHAREVAYITDHAGVAVLIADEEFRAKASAGIRAVVGHDELAGGSAEPVADADVGADDLQRILYTSGTTSRPKGVMHTHANVLFNQLGQLLELELTAADRPLLSAPLFHVSGLEVPGLATMLAGGTLVIARSYAGADIVDLIERERVTGVVLAAQIVYDILRLPDLGERDLGSLRFAVFGGLPVPDRERFHAALPHVRAIDTFGMTELTNGATYMDAAHAREKLGAQGTPFPFTDVRVVDEHGADVPPGVVGEIVARGPKVTPGYWRDPQATAAAFRDGWFHTGDMATIDADGYLWFADRKRDMIRSGGENIASAEVERVIAAHPDVAEVAVIGVPDERWDEVPKAFVIPRDGARIGEEDVLAHCNEHLARFKVPKHVALVRDLPRNDSGKVLKRLLEDPEAAASAAALNAREDR